jgi:hypothetical protein
MRRSTAGETVADHPRGNFWFASPRQDDDEKPPRDFRWRAYIQLPGMVDHLDAWFPSREACEDFIRNDVLGALLEDP